MPSFRGKLTQRQLAPEVSKQCRSLEKQQHVTGFMLHLAAFNALLSRYTQQRDILVGCPVVFLGKRSLVSSRVRNLMID